ncbi:MAG: hypothetical protein WAV05_09570 [Anaerolineales bacterium]
MSVALENARLWEQEKLYRKALECEFEIGREIQAGFLPDSLPQPQGWEIAASLKWAREVTGDFYDAFELTDGKIGLVIADVCDKGLGAALFMGECNLPALLEQIQEQVKDYSTGAKQFDDITMLAVRRRE